ncbi:MAG: hypothetical protein HY744_33065 [Deltaproteobacteria bacterium]|nr:hypothetical protein [Deltaproteobacteria bacterium]
MLALWLAGEGGCDAGAGNGPPPSGQAGAGGCPTGPQAQFVLHVTAEDGPVPADTSLRVKWSVGEEPEFLLSDPTTWKTLEDGSNLVCQVDADAGLPPGGLDELVCELWTSGATEVEVSATGYGTDKRTLMPEQIEGCDGPIPADVPIELVRALDGGAGE